MAANPKEVREGRTPTTVSVGENVYRARVLKNPKLSQRALADQAGVALETVRLIERNRLGGEQMSPQLDTIDKLAAALDVEAATLYEVPTRVVVDGKPPALRSIPGDGKGDPFSQPPLLRPV